MILRRIDGRRAGLAFLCGVLATAALPPFHLWPLILPAFSGFLWLLRDEARPRAALWLGWCFGFGHFVTGLYWISNALLVPPAAFLWMVPFALVGLPIVLAVFTGAIAWGVVRLAPPGKPWLRWLAFGTFWLLAEWLRAHVLTGFPWNLMATVWTDTPAPLQAVAVLGPYGVGAVTVLIGAAFSLGRQAGGAVAALGLALLWGGGALRLVSAPGMDAVQPGVTLKLVQPAIPQSLKWDRNHLQSNFQKYLALSAPAPGEILSAVIWGEAATGYPIEDVLPWRAAIAERAPADGVIITGTNRYLRDAQGNAVQAFNGMVAFDAEGSLRGAFDKFHLVPFGEYIPLKGLLPLQIVTQGASGYTPGPGPRTLRLPGLPPVAPLICYEVIFPDAVIDRADRPSWILNITNDGWYGVSTGPYQHLAATILRAVEEGLPLVRVANTGVSALIDGNGRIWNKLKLNEEAALSVPLPLPLDPPPYSRWGDLVTLLIVTFLLPILALLRLRPSL